MLNRHQDRHPRRAFCSATLAPVERDGGPSEKRFDGARQNDFVTKRLLAWIQTTGYLWRGVRAKHGEIDKMTILHRNVSAWLALLAVVAICTAHPFRADAMIPITECTQPNVGGDVILMADLSCSGPGHAIVLNGRTTLHLNGHTVEAGADRRGILCLGKCTILGPGTITNSGIGIGATGAKVSGVTISGVGIGIEIENFGHGKLVLRDSTISNAAAQGVLADRRVDLRDSSIVGSGGNGIEVASEDCQRGDAKLKNSVVTGSGVGDPACSVSRVCADLATCKAPRIKDGSQCETSYDLSSGVPGASWGVCNLD